MFGRAASQSRQRQCMRRVHHERAQKKSSRSVQCAPARPAVSQVVPAGLCGLEKRGEGRTPHPIPQHLRALPTCQFTFETTRLLDTGFGQRFFEGVIEAQLPGVSAHLEPSLGGGHCGRCPRSQINHADRMVRAGQIAFELFLGLGISVPSDVKGPRGVHKSGMRPFSREVCNGMHPVLLRETSLLDQATQATRSQCLSCNVGRRFAMRAKRIIRPRNA